METEAMLTLTLSLRLIEQQDVSSFAKSSIENEFLVRSSELVLLNVIQGYINVRAYDGLHHVYFDHTSSGL